MYTWCRILRIWIFTDLEQINWYLIRAVQFLGDDHLKVSGNIINDLGHFYSEEMSGRIWVLPIASYFSPDLDDIDSLISTYHINCWIVTGERILLKKGLASFIPIYFVLLAYFIRGKSNSFSLSPSFFKLWIETNEQHRKRE